MSVKRLGNVDGASIFNAVRSQMSQEFQDRIPEATLDNLKEIGLAITSANFTALFNEWQSALINRIGMVIFHDYTLQNRLAKYIYGDMEFGDAIEEIAVDIIKGYDMDYGQEGKSTDPFIKNSNEVKAIYHRINKPIQYTTTIERDRIKRAFLSPDGLSKLIGLIINKLYSSANLDTWTLTKDTMAFYINDGMAAKGFSLTADQKITATDITDKESGEDFILQLKNVISSMWFPNNKFNPMGIHKTLDNSQLTVFIRADVLNSLGVKAMANVFNPENLNIPVNFEPMDDFGIDPNGKSTDDVIAVVAEDNWLLITQQFDDVESIYNPRSRYWNYFLTRQMSFGTSYFKDCAILRKTWA